MHHCTNKSFQSERRLSGFDAYMYNGGFHELETCTCEAYKVDAPFSYAGAQTYLHLPP